jgi:hypothetical protein
MCRDTAYAASRALPKDYHFLRPVWKSAGWIEKKIAQATLLIRFGSAFAGLADGSELMLGTEMV